MSELIERLKWSIPNLRKIMKKKRELNIEMKIINREINT